MTRIAIVEDNKGIRESLAAYVHRDPELRCVCACGSAEEALEKLPRLRPDVVLMDIQLPSQSGIDCTAQLKQLLPEVRIIMVTAGEDEAGSSWFNSARTVKAGSIRGRWTEFKIVSTAQGWRKSPRQPGSEKFTQHPTTHSAEISQL